MSIEMKVDALEDTFARFIRHQNAALDLLVADKMATLSEDIDLVAHLASKNELMEVMDYGDTIAPAWTWDGTEYNPEMALCHDSDAELEDGETIHGAYFEWKNVLPFDAIFDGKEAIHYFDGTESVGDYYFTLGDYFGTYWVEGLNIQFTLSEVPAAGDQLYIDVVDSTVSPAGRPYYVYAKGSTTVKQQGTVVEGNSGTFLGELYANAENGKNNAISRTFYGYNRWSESNIRQWLNSDAPAGEWFTPQNPWDRTPAELLAKPGFLYGYSKDAAKLFKPTKIVTLAPAIQEASKGGLDVTYDRVFLATLWQNNVYYERFEDYHGEVRWNYYKRLLKTAEPLTATACPELVKNGLGTTTSRKRLLRNARYGSLSALAKVNTNGLISNNAANGFGLYAAPAVFISK